MKETEVVGDGTLSGGRAGGGKEGARTEEGNPGGRPRVRTGQNSRRLGGEGAMGLSGERLSGRGGGGEKQKAGRVWLEEASGRGKGTPGEGSEGVGGSSRSQTEWRWGRRERRQERGEEKWRGRLGGSWEGEGRLLGKGEVLEEGSIRESREL